MGRIYNGGEVCWSLSRPYFNDFESKVVTSHVSCRIYLLLAVLQLNLQQLHFVLPCEPGPDRLDLYALPFL